MQFNAPYGTFSRSRSDMKILMNPNKGSKQAASNNRYFSLRFARFYVEPYLLHVLLFFLLTGFVVGCKTGVATNQERSGSCSRYGG